MKRKYMGITIPYKYYDIKRNYTYYIYENKEYNDMNKLFKAFLGSYLTYHFEVKEKEIEVHNLSEVIENVIKNYDTFKIPTKYRKEYSSLELEYIKGLKEDLIKEKLKVEYNPVFKKYSKKDFRSAKMYKFSKEIDKKYNSVVVPKKIKDPFYKQEYYVVGGIAYESIYRALDVVYEGNLHYQFGGTKNPNNRTHQQAHNFDDLIGLIFAKSTKFIIHLHQQDFYSKQELDFLQKLADKINQMGFQSIEPTYEEEYTEDYNYLKDNHRYIGLLINNIKYKLKQKRHEKQVLQSHKI